MLNQSINKIKEIDINESPKALAWELTRACDLMCLHCRAAGRPKRHPNELKTDDAMLVLDQLAELQPGVVVLTGGDPFWREDLELIISEAKKRNLNIGLTPSATSRATKERIKACVDAGVRLMALSLDGACAAAHDTIRNVTGTFDKTVELAKIIRSFNVPLQINTTMMKRNVENMSAIANKVVELDATIWSVFFLVNVGRGKRQTDLTGEEGELALTQLADLAETLPLAVRTTAAPQYRRILAERGRSSPINSGVTDGSGACFISHTGDVYPTGFLPLKVGNIKEQSIKEIYTNTPIMKALKDRDNYHGRCGRCEHKWLCGGSRARAYASTKDYLGEDPLCPYVPTA